MFGRLRHNLDKRITFMTSGAGLTDSFKVGRYTVTMTLERAYRRALIHAVCEWEPGVPTRLSKRELKQYQNGRNALAARLAELLGGRALIVET